MPKSTIERPLPATDRLVADERRVIALPSCGALSTLGPPVQSCESDCTGHTMGCLERAAVREHARWCGLPVNIVAEVRVVIEQRDPAGHARESRITLQTDALEYLLRAIAAAGRSAGRGEAIRAPEWHALGERLRQHRLAAGLTQEGLAERAGLSARGLSDLERGLRQSPHPGTLRRLAEALGLGQDEQAVLAASASSVRSPNTACAQPAASTGLWRSDARRGSITAAERHSSRG